MLLFFLWIDIYLQKQEHLRNMPSVGCLHTSAPAFKLFIMCNHVFLLNSSRGASAGEILGRYQTGMHMQEKLHRHTGTPYGGSCRHHMFYKNPGERGRREI